MLVSNIFTINKTLNKNGELSKRWNKDLDNIQKLTIDALNESVIKDDTQVKYLHSKLNYKPFEHRDLKNELEIKVMEDMFDIIDYTTEVKTQITNWNLLAKWRIKIPNGIRIQSFNSMYKVVKWRKALTTKAKGFKTFLTNTFKENFDNEIHTEGCVKYILEVWMKSNIDIDNTIKAIQDSMEGVFFTNDKCIDEFLVVKKQGVEPEYIDYKIYTYDC